MESLELTESNIAKFIDVGEEALKPFELNLIKVILMLDEYTNCFPDKDQYEQIEDEEVKKTFFLAICLQWQYMIDNADMYIPADALVGQKVGRHSYDAIPQDALDKFSRWDLSAVNMLERKGLTCNGISLDPRVNCCWWL